VRHVGHLPRVLNNSSEPKQTAIDSCHDNITTLSTYTGILHTKKLIDYSYQEIVDAIRKEKCRYHKSKGNTTGACQRKELCSIPGQFMRDLLWT
jgi:hypothetical protein